VRSGYQETEVLKNSTYYPDIENLDGRNEHTDITESEISNMESERDVTSAVSHIKDQLHCVKT
jgi:hypothetical protein